MASLELLSESRSHEDRFIGAVASLVEYPMISEIITSFFVATSEICSHFQRKVVLFPPLKIALLYSVPNLMVELLINISIPQYYKLSSNHYTGLNI